MAANRIKGSPPSCHPDRKHYARGMCERCYMTEFRRKNPEHVAYMVKYARQYRKDNKEKIAALDKARRARPDIKARHNEVSRWSRFKSVYGLEKEQILSMLDSQRGGCAICNKEIAIAKNAHIDHCHTTNIVRGLLCKQCNMALGLFKESSVFLKRAAEYVGKSPAIKE